MTAFATLLTTHRTRARLSQSRLAALAGFDHSTVNRWESGARLPQRSAVERLAAALALSQPDTDTLLMAAGYLGELEPVLVEAAALLGDEGLAREVRDEVRRRVRMACCWARQMSREAA
jgi:transcriptional regulator with XRE-family HTH domain